MPIIIYSSPSILSNLNFNPLNVITVSLKLTLLVPFKANPSNAKKSISMSSMPLEIGSIYLDFKNFIIKIGIEEILSLVYLKKLIQGLCVYMP
jgi:hypothetical protein